MQDSKLIDLLKTFDKEDWRWFRKFLLSPYFNSREDLLPFFDYLRKQAPHFNEKAIRKEKVFKKVYPNQKYDEKQISYAMNFLQSQAERFLAQRELEKHPPVINNHLLKSLVNRQLDKNYRYQFEKSKNSLEQYKTKEIDYYFFKYQQSEIGDAYFMSQNLRRHDNQLQDAYDQINEYYFLKVVKHGCEMLVRKKLYGIGYELTFMNDVINFLKKETNLAPLILIYLQIYLSLSEENPEEHFENIIQLSENEQGIPPTEKRIISGYAINFCALQISKRNNLVYYAEQCLALYLRGIKEGFLLNKGNLTPWTFKNVVKLGLNLRKYDFTENFIQTYHKKLDKEFQEDALHFNLADINYRKKNYQVAQTHLLQVQFSDIFYNLGAKAMLLKIYYETNEGDALFALIASFSIYLRRNKKIAKNVRDDYLNFATILGRIVRATKDKYPKIIEKINNTNPLNSRSWLLEICQPKRKTTPN